MESRKKAFSMYLISERAGNIEEYVFKSITMGIRIKVRQKCKVYDKRGCINRGYILFY